MKPTMKFLIPAVMAFSLIACGGSSSNKDGNSGGTGPTASSYSGKTTAAVFEDLTTDDKQEIGESSTEVAFEASGLAENDYLDFLPFGGVIEENNKNDQEKSQQIAQKSLRQASKFLRQHSISLLDRLPLGIKETHKEQCDSGSVTGIININDQTGHGTISITYHNCRDNYGGGDYDLYKGALVFRTSHDNKTNKTTIKIEFKNFEETEVWLGDKYTFKMNGYYEVTYEGDHPFLSGFFDDDECDYDDDECWEELDFLYGSGTYTAKWDLSGSEDGRKVTSKGELECNNNSCSLTSDIESKNGKVFRVEGIKVSHNVDDGTGRIEGKMYHPDYGHYEFEIQVDYVCSDEEGSLSPFEGYAKFTDANGDTFTYSSANCYSEPLIE